MQLPKFRPLYPEDASMELVEAMHRKFGIAYDGPPRKLPPEEFRFRVAAMKEELQEYIDSEGSNLIDQYDALLDLITFALGTLHRQGLPFLEGHVAVMSCNMKKEVGPNPKRGGFSQDLRKPEGWYGPEGAHQRIINELEEQRVG